MNEAADESLRLEAVEKLTFSEQPLDRNHAFDRIPKKNRALQAHFFFPCINSEVHKVNCRIAAKEGGLGHAPGNYEFAVQILFYACCRTKHQSDFVGRYLYQNTVDVLCGVFLFFRARRICEILQRQKLDIHAEKC